MRTKALASALVLFGSTAALAQVADTPQEAPTNNTQAEEVWEDNSGDEALPPQDAQPAEEALPPAEPAPAPGDEVDDEPTEEPTDLPPPPPQG